MRKKRARNVKICGITECSRKHTSRKGESNCACSHILHRSALLVLLGLILTPVLFFLCGRLFSPLRTVLKTKLQSLPDGAYGAEEKLTDGAHPSYIENTAKTTPAEQVRLKHLRPVTSPRLLRFSVQTRTSTTSGD